MTLSLTIILNAMTLISILMLVSLGLAVIYGLMGVINLSHGDFITIGAFCLAVVQGFGGSFWLALIIAPLVEAALACSSSNRSSGFSMPARLRRSWRPGGLSLIIQQSLQLIFGAAPQKVFSPITASIDLFGVSYPAYRILMIAMAIAIIAAAYLFIRRTRFGPDPRTVIQDPDMAEALGIDTRRVYAIAFSLGTGVATIAGVLLAPLTTVIAQKGVNYPARSFFVVIVGGAGSVPGVVAGSTFVGGIETLFNYVIPATLSQALVLVPAIVLVRLRPTGLVAE